MNAEFPAYYTTLKPFAGLFAQGLPVLTYHKLGPRPARARIKGLYMGCRLFERQLAELKEVGFTTARHGLPADFNGNAGKRVALSFDDGVDSVLKYGLKPMADHGFHAIEFLVADRLGGGNTWEVEEGEVRVTLMDSAQVSDWLAAGHEIGSHTLTHPFLTRVSLPRAREEIFASKKTLEDLFGLPVRHFCYPYGDWNPRIRDLVGEAGYETACTTDFGVNTAATGRFELKRITARHQSLSFKSLGARLVRSLQT